MLIDEKIRRYKGHIYVVLALLLAAILGSVFLLPRGTIEQMGSVSDVIHFGPLDTKSPKLVDVLKNGAMANRTVILATLTEAWAKPGSIFDTFLESFRIGEETQALMKHLVIIATDHKAMARCKELQLHCYLLSIEDMSPSASEKKFLTKDYISLIWGRLHFFGKVLELGYNFLLTDVDIVWFRTPFGRLYPSDDIAVSCDTFNGNSSDPENRPNVGFIFVKSNNRTINFYKKWYQMRSQYPEQLTQIAFNNIKRGGHVKIRYLDTAVFGGFCQHGQDMNKLRSLHANCCVGLDRKIYDLKMVLDVWRNFSRLPLDRKAEGLPWKAPIKCDPYDFGRKCCCRCNYRNKCREGSGSWLSLVRTHLQVGQDYLQQIPPLHVMDSDNSVHLLKKFHATVTKLLDL